jgi:hypothetical protein
MRRILTLWFGLVLLPMAAAAQDVYPPAESAHRAGRWSMQFEVGDHFQLVPFEGAGLAVTRNTSPSGAWRFAVGLNGDFVDGSRTTRNSLDGVGNEQSEDAPSSDTYDARLDLLRMKRFAPERRVGLEIGFGPRVQIHHDTLNEQYRDSLGIGMREHKDSSQFYGLLGRIGAEVFLVRSVSASASYGASFGYFHRQINEDIAAPATVSKLDADLNDWNLSTVGVTFGISVYL